MILVQPATTGTLTEIGRTLQRAVQLEFATLPPYLYAWYSTGPNAAARDRILDIVHEEMIHMMLVCNIMNSLGFTPQVADTAAATVVPTYPGPLPYSIGSGPDGPFVVHLLGFSEAAMAQAAKIEEPEHKIAIPLAAVEPEFQTIGQFYAAVKGSLPDDGWNPVNQIDSATAFAGELFPIPDKHAAEKAIDRIVSQGEGTEAGTDQSPLDFEAEVSHFYRFSEIEKNKVLRKDSGPTGYRWGESLGIDFSSAVPAIDDPGTYDFSGDPPAQAAQDRCDTAFTSMVQELQRTVTGDSDRLGNAVRQMFDLSRAARAALEIELAGRPGFVAGPAFRFRPELTNRG
ncbi:MAG: ferritin-like domain-containing protein [Acidimicrobiales bacterium]